MEIHSCICPVVIPPTPIKPKPATAPHRADPKNILGSGRIHPELAKKMRALIEKASAQGLKIQIVEGYRDMKRQAALARDPRGVTRAKAGYSFHNYGLAVDIAFQDDRGNPSWGENHDWKRLGEIGKEVGLYWGGDWKSLKDRAHFQLVPNDRIQEVRRLSQEVGMGRMWERIR